MHRDSASLLATGDIQGLLDLHRSTFGDTRMEGEGGDGGGEGGDGSGGGAGGGNGWTPPATQAELDRLIADRLTRQKAQLTKNYEGFDDFKKKAEEFDKLTESQKSELQKAQDRAEKAEQAAAASTQRVVMAEIRAIATGEFEDPSDAHLYLGDTSKLLDKNGDPDAAAIEEALKEVLKAKPHLAARRAGTDVGLGARNAGGTAPGMNDLLRQSAGRR